MASTPERSKLAGTKFSALILVLLILWLFRAGTSGAFSISTYTGGAIHQSITIEALKYDMPDIPSRFKPLRFTDAAIQQIVISNIYVDKDSLDVPSFHFDDNGLQAGSAVLIERKRTLITALSSTVPISQQQAIKARQLL